MTLLAAPAAIAALFTSQPARASLTFNIFETSGSVAVQASGRLALQSVPSFSGGQSHARTPLLLPELLRNALASLALALGFAALARRPGSDLSILQELQSRTWRSPSGLSRRFGSVDADDLQQLGRDPRDH